MNVVDIIILVCLVLGALAGFHKGVIKSLVQLIGTVGIAVLAYYLKDFAADFLIDKLPFFNFGGIFEGVTAMNVVLYELVSFVVIYVVLYCVLNIIISLSGLIEKLLKLTVVLAIPSKILGLIVGAIEGLAFAFLIVYIMFQIEFTTNFVKESTSGVVLLERMPLMGQIMAKTTLAMEDINKLLNEFKDNENRKEVNVQVFSTLVHYNIVDKDEVLKIIKDKKLELDNVTFS